MKCLNLTKFEAEYLFKLVNVDIDGNTLYLSDEFNWRYDLKNKLRDCAYGKKET